MAVTDDGLMHAAGCLCTGCMKDATGDQDATGGTADASGGGTVVDDYTALLYYPTYTPGRWNATTDLGTPTIVTYSFTDETDLPALADYDPYGAEGYWAYDAAQQAVFNEMLDKFEAVAGVKFVEIEGPSMINIFGADVSGVGGWANIPAAYDASTSNGSFVNAYGSMDEGQYGYQVNMHELGHALGLKHPHDGTVVLSEEMDTQANSVMTYNIEWPYATELGPLDIAALQDIYGDAAGFDGWTITSNASDVITVKSTAQADVILATDLDTVIFSFGGDDEIIGREGDDKALAGNGNDTLTGSAGEDRLFGGNGDDLIFGHLDAVAYGGDDTDADVVFGNAGDDTIYGNAGNDNVNGGDDQDLLFGGNGDDGVRGADGDDTMYGGSGNDSLLGGNGADIIAGEGDDDRMFGGAGNDVLDGGWGDDLLLGGNDNDTLDGGSGEDKLLGGAGDDIIAGGDGADLLWGQGGADTFVFTNSDAYETDKIFGFEVGSDQIDLSAFGFMNWGVINVAQAGAHTTVSYSNWFEVSLLNFDADTLSADDFIFA